MKDPCKTATCYAEQLTKCKTLDELRSIWQDINIHIKDVEGWYKWLIDWKDSCKNNLSMPETPDEEFLNTEGLKAKKQGLI